MTRGLAQRPPRGLLRKPRSVTVIDSSTDVSPGCPRREPTGLVLWHLQRSSQWPQAPSTSPAAGVTSGRARRPERRRGWLRCGLAAAGVRPHAGPGLGRSERSGHAFPCQRDVSRRLGLGNVMQPLAALPESRTKLTAHPVPGSPASGKVTGVVLLAKIVVSLSDSVEVPSGTAGSVGELGDVLLIVVSVFGAMTRRPGKNPAPRVWDPVSSLHLEAILKRPLS